MKAGDAAWDDAKALGLSKSECVLACMGAWAEVWEAAGLPIPAEHPWEVEDPTDDQDP